MGGSILDPETQQLLKKRLQSLGDVVVHASDKFEACCASGRVIQPGALRVRPRRCDHVFLVECLMPYWAEGLCPVCRCSFAYDRPQDAGYDESDKYSSVSTSISQALPRHVHSSSNSDGGPLRGPRALHTIGEGSKESRGRSPVLSIPSAKAPKSHEVAHQVPRAGEEDEVQLRRTADLLTYSAALRLM